MQCPWVATSVKTTHNGFIYSSLQVFLKYLFSNSHVGICLRVFVFPETSAIQFFREFEGKPKMPPTLKFGYCPFSSTKPMCKVIKKKKTWVFDRWTKGFRRFYMCWSHHVNILISTKYSLNKPFSLHYFVNFPE